MIKLVNIFILTTLLLFSSSVMAKTFEGIDYKIIDATRMKNIKCSLDVRLSKKVTKDVLHRLAMKLRADESSYYKRMFITYYLPGMTPGAGAWATSHFNPSLEIKILGLTAEEENKLKKKTSKSSGTIIGKWIDNSGYGEGIIIIERNKDTLIFTKTFKDGSVLKQEMIMKRLGSRTRYEKKGGSSHGEYYLLDNRGLLGIYDGMGLIKTHRPIK